MAASKKTSSRVAPRKIYQLLVALDDIQPSIWRRIWVADTLTLAKLDRVIQAAMGWTNSHLHEFEIDGQRYGIPDDEWPDDNPPLDETRARVGRVLGDDVNEFTYLYDFGDHWHHSVKVEMRMLPNEINLWPMCLAGKNACPPEDVGGTGGYMEFLEAISDPTHKEHVAMWRWAGGPFDPQGFDINATNLALRSLET
ncbi:plasmid pRiA4b ORF-3 family protein [Variovorax sp. J22R24]|uniref:plasmid pRiA4b ORF-3 family protein n=1 Tax=Variovorax gracilis TaxID=3053502 RepID=UPI002575860E|nr:plasmid pRiA4b ORF-3 family protein [Variovorax sp. J22R24]MDM0109652.1 plasmid pRiA4b ORF-3 family protein [Variovorax sp. J22R24]